MQHIFLCFEIGKHHEKVHVILEGTYQNKNDSGDVCVCLTLYCHELNTFYSE